MCLRKPFCSCSLMLFINRTGIIMFLKNVVELSVDRFFLFQLVSWITPIEHWAGPGDKASMVSEPDGRPCMVVAERVQERRHSTARVGCCSFTLKYFFLICKDMISFPIKNSFNIKRKPVEPSGLVAQHQTETCTRPLEC